MIYISALPGIISRLQLRNGRGFPSITREWDTHLRRARARYPGIKEEEVQCSAEWDMWRAYCKLYLHSRAPLIRSQGPKKHAQEHGKIVGDLAARRLMTISSRQYSTSKTSHLREHGRTGYYESAILVDRDTIPRGMVGSTSDGIAYEINTHGSLPATPYMILREIRIGVIDLTHHQAADEGYF
jgi:hypothetical protein